MDKQNVFMSIASYIVGKWQQMLALLQRRNDAAVAAWGASLQHRRRFTNPEEAKRFRKN